jgi:4-amino-4-deoxy-L-arabinose transferase-like glycosyltransferase
MQARGDWVLPTAGGQPYLAKPPMMYWWQLALAELRGGRTGELELRLTVAIAGWLGVLATYILGRRLFRDERPPGGYAPREVAWWSALFLATGLLYVRSARIGELDILLVPFTVVSIAATFEAWRSHRRSGRTNLPAVGLACVAAAGASLTKGPPAILTPALASFGGILLWHGIDLPPGSGTSFARRGWRVLVAFSRTHPLAVLGLPLAAYFGWLWIASGRLPPGVALASFEAERVDNLRLFVPRAPAANLEAAAYGVGLGSLACIGALAWLIRRRVRPSPGLCVLLAWVVGGLLAFSILGKGVPRYLTPLWPGIALLGGLWWARTLPLLPRPRLVRGAAAVLVIALAGAEAAWYGYGREALQPERSPRAFVRELLARPDVDPARMALFEFSTPAIDFYAGRSVEAFRDSAPRPGMMGVGPRTLSDLEQEARTAPMVLLIRRTQPPGMDPAPALDRLRAGGLTVEPLPLRSRFRVDNKRSEIIAVRISASR